MSRWSPADIAEALSRNPGLRRSEGGNQGKGVAIRPLNALGGQQTSKKQVLALPSHSLLRF